MGQIAEQYKDRRDNLRCTGDDQSGRNQYKNLASLSLREIESVLLSDFCPSELVINLKSGTRAS